MICCSSAVISFCFLLWLSVICMSIGYGPCGYGHLHLRKLWVCWLYELLLFGSVWHLLCYGFWLSVCLLVMAMVIFSSQNCGSVDCMNAVYLRLDLCIALSLVFCTRCILHALSINCSFLLGFLRRSPEAVMLCCVLFFCTLSLDEPAV